MRNRGWIGAALSGLVVALAACGGQTQGAPASPRGSEVFVRMGCGTCHAADGRGGQFGPPLHGKKHFWTREKLVAYLKNPSAYAQGDARLAEQSKKFMLPMQRFDMLPPAELEALADHVLAMP